MFYENRFYHAQTLTGRCLSVAFSTVRIFQLVIVDVAAAAADVVVAHASNVNAL